MNATDAIALASIGSSAAIAIVTVAASAFGARGQRQHETRLSFEGRAWDRKVDAHLAMIRHVLAIQKIFDGQPTWFEIRQLARERDSIVDDVQPTLTAYASSACLTETEALLNLLSPSLDACRSKLNRLDFTLKAIEKRGTEAAEAGEPSSVLVPGIAEFQQAADELVAAFSIDDDKVLRQLPSLLRSTRASLKDSAG